MDADCRYNTTHYKKEQFIQNISGWDRVNI